jgi:hypothetical protein
MRPHVKTTEIYWVADTMREHGIVYAWHQLRYDWGLPRYHALRALFAAKCYIGHHDGLL